MTRLRLLAPHTAGRRRTGLVTAEVIALFLVMTACTIGASQRPPLATFGEPPTASAGSTGPSSVELGPGGPGRNSAPIEWAPCPDTFATVDPASGRRFAVQCADVAVPKSYDKPGSGSLSIAVSKATAPGLPQDAPTLLVMLGEPGENGTHETAAVAGSLPKELAVRYAVVLVDLRGTGDSLPIDCLSGTSARGLLALDADPTTPAAATALAGLSRTLTFDCGDMVGPGLSQYASVPAADDLDTIRAAVGQQRISVLGRGFGATLAAVYLDRYPGRVEAAVLDGPADPRLAADKQAGAIAQASERALDSFAAACQAFAGGCPLGAAPRTAVTALVGRLGDRGVLSSDGQPVTGGSVLWALGQFLGRPDSWPDLAAALTAAGRSDVNPLARLLTARFSPDRIAQQLAGRLVYRCNDSGLRLGADRLQASVTAARKAAPLFGPYLLAQVGLCADWPAPGTALGGVEGAGAPPVVVVGAVEDPTAPFSGVRSLAALLSSAVLLSWQSGQHGSYPASSCVAGAVNTYLLQHKPPVSGTLCPP